MTSPLDQIRNIGIIAHIDAGKTTTTERILYYSGTTHRMGDVDDGTTTTDFDPEEAQRGITIYSAAITCQWAGCQVNIIDTPGHVDFTAEVERSLRVLDGGVVIFSAVEGVEAQSETVWRQADRYGVPRICFINKLDRIGANYSRVLDQMRGRLRAVPLPVQLPIGMGPATGADGFRGLIDLIERQALYFDRESKGQTIRVEAIPPHLIDEAEAARTDLLDAVVLLDDDAFAEYDQTGDLPPSTLKMLLRKATLSRVIQPVFCGASLDYIGVQPLLDGVVNYLPSPLDRAAVQGTNPSVKKGGQIEVRRPSEQDPFCGLVFKIVADQHSELYFVRIYSGVLKSRTRMLNPRTGGKEMITQLWKIQADDRVQLEEASAGDIVGVVGPKDCVTGDTLCDPQQGVLLETIRFPETVISMAIEPDSSADRKKLEETLKLMAKQDPTFTAKISEETGQTIISGMGELHLEIISKRMQRDFNLKMRVHKPRVTYRESVNRTTDVKAVFERSTPAGNLFAAVTIRLEPLEGEQGVVVRNQLKPGTLTSAQDEILVQALNEESRGGGLVGYPLVGVKLTLLDVKTREGETNDVALQAATAQAMRQALQESGTILLEPIMKLEVATPEDFVGNVSADLNSRRAMIVNTELRGHLVILEAEAPLSEMFGYSTQVRSLSQGRASYSMEFLRFSEAPPSVLKQMLS